ncbi:DUF1569 domain-containing protein [Aquabacterium sp. OR-4]|uniref:DUF1569 domain-containing protein n=1 Tax=Aquabacterium sp. OR-4 TaxID=2978127 RepID=UPI0028C915CA|nr:DUF1569 domain-containing protein [Aquabacterium sp. OR-4]MDT7837246.1 DUF1569 domain-containing protein [Aquabacterium sp. OR-4]
MIPPRPTAAGRRGALLTLGALAAVPLAGCEAGVPRVFASLGAARQAIAALAHAPGARSSGAWALPQVLVHLAQSIEYSLQGYPVPRSALFQQTLGRVAFAVFDARGAMHHALDEPIPGAPALAGGVDLPAAAARLLAAIDAFDAHAGVLQPHFAYGALDKPAYTRAHLMHIGQHWSEVLSAT